MSTISQIEANRENAIRSTGPRSEAGKETSSRNSTRHGLTSRRGVLDSEDQPEFDQLLMELLQEYDPQTPTERELVDEIADQSWRLRRASKIETGLFNKAGDDFQAVSADLDKIRRYRTSIERAWHKAIEQIRKIQKQPAKPVTEQRLKEIRTAAFDSALKMILGAPLPGQGPESAIDIDLDADSDDEDLEVPVDTEALQTEEAA